MRKFVGITLTFVVLLVAFWDASYTGRRTIARVSTASERAQCAASQRKSWGTMESWYAAYLALAREAIAKGHEGPRSPDAMAARVYLWNVKNLMAFEDPQYSLVWPDPATEPGPYKHPLGYGHYVCSEAVPSPHVSPFQFGLP